VDIANTSKALGRTEIKVLLSAINAKEK